MNGSRERMAVVTGGGTGIGRATAELLLAHGYTVVAIGLEREDDLPATLQFRKVDLTDDDTILALGREFDRVDVLVNAAGMLVHGGGEFEIRNFRRVMAVNLESAAAMSFALQDALERAKGCIINFASMHAVFGSPLTPAYGASKSALVQLTKSLAVAWGPRGIRVNAVAPGWIETRLSQNALNSEERASGIMTRLPLKRWGAPKEVAEAILFLVSDNASYISGTTLTVDGGYSAA